MQKDMAYFIKSKFKGGAFFMPDKIHFTDRELKATLLALNNEIVKVGENKDPKDVILSYLSDLMKAQEKLNAELKSRMLNDEDTK